MNETEKRLSHEVAKLSNENDVLLQALIIAVEGLVKATHEQTNPQYFIDEAKSRINK